MRIQEPFHRGERRVQERLGEIDGADRNGRVIQEAILPGAFEFIATRPFIVAASVSEEGTWASIVFGERGFASVHDSDRVAIDLARTEILDADPLLKNLDADPRIGLLFLDPESRRRYRINGLIERDGDSLQVAVHEAYPNCPKYIQRRHLRPLAQRSDEPDESPASGSSLGERERLLIQEADTAFVASSNPQGHLDVSHRGGPSGFVRVLDESTLEIPDYPGNKMYNTLGNVEMNESAGLSFLDFGTGRALYLSGRAEIVWKRDGQEASTGGTNRFLRFRLDRWMRLKVSNGRDWELLDSSPFNPPPN